MRWLPTKPAKLFQLVAGVRETRSCVAFVFHAERKSIRVLIGSLVTLSVVERPWARGTACVGHHCLLLTQDQEDVAQISTPIQIPLGGRGV